MGKKGTSYTFANLSESAYYKKWLWEITFALHETENWG